MQVVAKRLDIRRVLTNQLDGKPECAGGIDVVVEEELPMHRTGLEHLSLQGNSDCDRLFLAHCTYPCGTGSGGSCGAKGGVSGISTIAVNITDRLQLLRAKSSRKGRRNAISAERRYL